MSTARVGPRPAQSICVYCGSADGADPAFMAAARELGQAIAAAGFGLVYGGGGIGMMGEVAKSTRAAGGYVLGIIPQFLREKEAHYREASEMIVTADMHERKMRMFDYADAFVAMPGGIGTLEELIEQMTWSQLGRHGKPIIIADIAGFWQPLLGLVEHMRVQGFLRKPFVTPSTPDLYHVVTQTSQIVPTIGGLLASAVQGDAQTDAGREIKARF